MNYARIKAALQKATDTREVVIGVGAVNSVNETFIKCFQDQPAIMVADENTFAAAGQAVQQQLTAANCWLHIFFRANRCCMPIINQTPLHRLRSGC